MGSEDSTRGAFPTVGAIVLGGGHVGLAITRSLGRRGIPVWCLTERPDLPTFSRYCRRRIAWHEHDTRRQRDFLLSLSTHAPVAGWMLFPTSDETAKVLAYHHAELGEQYALTVPPWQIFRLAYDKRLAYQLAMQLDIDVPSTYAPVTRDEAATLACTFPAILKPAIKESHNAFTSGKAWRVEDRQDMLARYDEACSLVPADTVLIQELIPGGASAQLSFAALCSDGEIVACLAACRARQYPDEFGVATYVVTEMHPELKSPARTLLSAMRYTGVVEMDFIHDARYDRYLLLDVNPRPWSWLGLGWRAGIDFPYLLWELVHGRNVQEHHEAIDVRWLHLLPDLQSALRTARYGGLDVMSYTRTLFGRGVGAVFAADDPLPGMMEPLLLLKARLQH